eukprot:GHVP01056350.1.p1 GENE.GHVP01056350.1~~GHVP01056350.1.p1  ORF type:complete len:263 (-),score=65.17 GHVP01056350.1:330-1118(-)
MNWFYSQETPSEFERTYKPVRISSTNLPDDKKERTLNGGKIFLPESSLENLLNDEIPGPMTFSLCKEIDEDQEPSRITHVGVLEFIATEGFVYIPDSIFDSLELNASDFVVLKSTTLPKGELIKLQPFTSNFLSIQDPRSILEHHLRKFTALTKNDIVEFAYLDESHKLSVVETSPENGILITDTDISVEFLPPIDYDDSHPSTKDLHKYKTELSDKIENTKKKWRTVSGNKGESENSKEEPSVFGVNIPDNVLFFYPEKKT